MKLVPDWRSAWKWLSVQVPAINTAFLTTWALLPPKFQDALPLPAVLAIAISLLLTGMAGRLLDQTEDKK